MSDRRYYSPQECFEIMATQKHKLKINQKERVAYDSILKCIEYAIKQDEIARELNYIKLDIDKHDAEIRADERNKFAKWLEEKGLLIRMKFCGDADWDELSADDVLAEYGKEQKNEQYRTLF